MGASIEEWTASSVEWPKETRGAGRIAVKGAFAGAPAAAHRCAARHALEPYSGAGRPIGFRCCSGGAPHGPTIPAIEPKPTFRRVEAPRIADIFATNPELARVKQGPHLFKETEIAEVVGHAKGTDGYTVGTEPILWSPVAGTEVLVMTGRSRGGASWIVALHRLPDDRWRLASSLVFANEPGPIVLAWQGNVKKEIAWSMCWGCPGESGAITWRDDHRVVIVQR